MKVCDRCKDSDRKIRMVMIEKLSGTEYDLCEDCAKQFIDDFLILKINKTPPKVKEKKAEEKKEDSDATRRDPGSE